MRSLCGIRYVTLMGWLVMAAAAGCACAEPLTPLGEGDRNTRLRVQLDRRSIKAFEPVYLGISAEQFAENLGIQIAIRRGNAPWQTVVIPTDPQRPLAVWNRFESHSSPGLPLLKMGMPLLVGQVGDQSRFIFSLPGDYKIRVKVGPDSTVLELVVVASAPDDEQAATILGTDMFPRMFEYNFKAQPDKKLQETAIRVIAEYPGSTTANYCQAYLLTTKFRSESNKHEPPLSNKAFYGPLADELDKSADIFRDSFFGEEIGFFTAYAHGLSGDFSGLLKTAELTSTRFTPWADALLDLKKDVKRHVRGNDRIVPVDVPLRP